MLMWLSTLAFDCQLVPSALTLWYPATGNDDEKTHSSTRNCYGNTRKKARRSESRRVIEPPTAKEQSQIPF